MNDLDPISQALDAATPIGQLTRPTAHLPAPEDVPKEAPEIEEDFQEARSNLRELISQAMEQIPDMINLMSQSQSEKMISAVSSFMKTTADLNTSLSKLSKEIKRQPKSKDVAVAGQNQPQTTSIENAVFVGSTEDFLRMLSDRKKQEAIDADFVEVEEK